MYIDCHVHCRDDSWSYKSTIEECLRISEKAGLVGIFDMPNTEPPVINRKRVLERFALAEKANSRVFYGSYIGLTSDKNQIREAVETYREFVPKNFSKFGVVGLKMFAGKSVGSLSVTSPEEQLEVYRQLTNFGFGGALVVHCEKESLLKSKLWNPQKPSSWSDARPEQSEVESVRDQINLSKQVGYMGHIHFAHISVPESAIIIKKAGGRAMRYSIGVTPHHLMNNTDDQESDFVGLMYKVNPPLRKKETQQRLLKMCIAGEFDILESDHAPHTLDEKLGRAKDNKGNPVYMSGIYSLPHWPEFASTLIKLGVSPQLIAKMSYASVKDIFRIGEK